MLGQRIRRREDPRFLTGYGQYVDDLKLPGARHATFVRSDWAHAKILGVDTDEAHTLPGVEVLTAAEVGLELVRMETPTPVNPLGAKGIGESGTIGSTPSVHNAVIDALAHLGVRHLDMPVNGERVWRPVAQAEQRDSR